MWRDWCMLMSLWVCWWCVHRFKYVLFIDRTGKNDEKLVSLPIFCRSKLCIITSPSHNKTACYKGVTNTKKGCDCSDNSWGGIWCQGMTIDVVHRWSSWRSFRRWVYQLNHWSVYSSVPEQLCMSKSTGKYRKQLLWHDMATYRKEGIFVFYHRCVNAYDKYISIGIYYI